MSTVTKYVVVPAPGHYGDRARVQSAHASYAAAKRAAVKGLEVVRISALAKGDEWLRVYESTSPIASQ